MRTDITSWDGNKVASLRLFQALCLWRRAFWLPKYEESLLFLSGLRYQQLLQPELVLRRSTIRLKVVTLEDQYITLMNAAGRVSDEWCREKFIQEADNVLMHINAQVLKNRQELNSMAA